MPDILDGILEREGGFGNDPADHGGRTDKGISEAANPEAWADGVVTTEEARAIFERKYLHSTGISQIEDPHIREQALDFCVNSGPGPAITSLQRTLHVEADGIIGPETLSALARVDARRINNMLVAERIKMLCRIVKRDPSQNRFLLGWVSRALDFLL